MTIHVVQPGETITSIANQYDVTPERLITDNELPNPENLVVGQSIVVQHAEIIHTVEEGDSLYNIAETYGVTPNQILQNNPSIGELGYLVPGETIVIKFAEIDEKNKLGNIIIGGYAYPFIDRAVLRKTLPFLTYLYLFAYGFTPTGDLIPIDDEELIELARSYSVGPILVLAPMTPEGNFSNELAHTIFTNQEAQNRLIDNLIATMKAKNYVGMDVDFEFVLPEDKDSFIQFIRNLKNRLEPEGLSLMVALAPKVSAEQAGLLYQAHDYPTIGAIADRVLLMTYEWGFTFGPPMATAPLASVRRVLEYGITEIDNKKILMGIPNYAYDWPLPFIRGQSAAESISNVEAIERAAQNRVTIQFDEEAQAPFYYYTNPQGIAHVVWFDDARSMEAKHRLINEYQLSGSGVWQIMNFFPQMWLVVNSLYNVQKVL